MRKMERLDIQKIESYWINHDENKKRLKYREWELLHSRHNADDLNANLRGNRISNPTEQKAAALTNDELYRNLNKIVQSIEQIYEQLDEDLKTIGTKHIAFAVDDLSELLARCASCGADIVFTAKRAGNQMCFLRDPDGVLIEFIQKDDNPIPAAL